MAIRSCCQISSCTPCIVTGLCIHPREFPRGVTAPATDADGRHHLPGCCRYRHLTYTWTVYGKEAWMDSCYYPQFHATGSSWRQWWGNAAWLAVCPSVCLFVLLGRVTLVRPPVAYPITVRVNNGLALIIPSGPLRFRPRGRPTAGLNRRSGNASLAELNSLSGL